MLIPGPVQGDVLHPEVSPMGIQRVRDKKAEEQSGSGEARLVIGAVFKVELEVLSDGEEAIDPGKP